MCWRARWAGKPVVVEKPMALNTGECEEMIAACRAAGIPLFVAYYRRGLPRFLKVKELIDGGAIGEVRFVTVLLQQKPVPEDIDPANLPWRVLPEFSGGGRFVDMGSHTLDFLDYVLGPIRSVQGHAGNSAGFYPAEDTVTATFDFVGVLGAGAWNFTSYGNRDATEIVGSRGKVVFSSFDVEPITLETAEGVQALAIENPAHVHSP